MANAQNRQQQDKNYDRTSDDEMVRPNNKEQKDRTPPEMGTGDRPTSRMPGSRSQSGLGTDVGPELDIDSERDSTRE